jgi:hypothetical protein
MRLRLNRSGELILAMPFSCEEATSSVTEKSGVKGS